MCRQHRLWGYLLISFGLGLLVGIWLSDGFLSHCLGFGLLVIGAGMLRRR